MSISDSKKIAQNEKKVAELYAELPKIKDNKLWFKMVDEINFLQNTNKQLRKQMNTKHLRVYNPDNIVIIK